MKNKLISSFGYAIKGIQHVVANERNMKIHISVLLLVIIAGIFFHISNLEWMVCFLCFGTVLSAEAFNTAIEKLVDQASPDFNPKYGEIKDIAAGAVLIITVFAIIIGLIIFFPKGILYIHQQ